MHAKPLTSGTVTPLTSLPPLASRVRSLALTRRVVERGAGADPCTLVGCSRHGSSWEGRKVLVELHQELQYTEITHHLLTKFWNSKLKPWSEGSVGGADCMTQVRTSKSVLQFWYGNFAVASSTKVMPKDHTSARMSYSDRLGSIRSGAKYATHPAARVFAFELFNWPLIPKSHNLIMPRSSTRIFDGFTSRCIVSLSLRNDSALTTCNGKEGLMVRVNVKENVMHV